MKIAISASGPGWDVPVDTRFGRAQGFAVVDTEETEPVLNFIENSQNLNAAQGAGIQAAEAVAATGARVLLTGHVGPKAFRALRAAGIDIFTGANGTVSEALASYQAGHLSPASSADVEGHW